MKTNTLTPELLDAIDAFWRAANDLSVGQIYLFDNRYLKVRVVNVVDLKKQLQAKRIEHKRYIDKNGQDLPEIRNWKWLP